MAQDTTLAHPRGRLHSAFPLPPPYIQQPGRPPWLCPSLHGHCLAPRRLCNPAHTLALLQVPRWPRWAPAPSLGPERPPPGLCLWAHALATCNSLLNINHPNPLSSKTAALPHLTAPASPNAPPPELMYQAHCLSLRERAANCAAKMRPRCSANMEETAPPCAPSPGLYHCLLPV